MWDTHMWNGTLQRGNIVVLKSLCIEFGFDFVRASLTPDHDYWSLLQRFVRAYKKYMWEMWI